METLSHAPSPSLVDAALEYAARGWRVFPAHSITDSGCSCGETDCSRAAKHPRIKGWTAYAATSNPATVKQYWTRWPDANIGIQCGGDFGPIVFDLDNKNGHHGTATFERFCKEYNWQPHTFSTSTPNFGEQKLFHSVEGMSIKNGTNVLGDGIDIRGDNGYIIAPPSIGANGRRYQVLTPDAELEDLPERILAALPAKPLYVAHGGAILRGGRHKFIFGYACSLRGKGYTVEQAAFDEICEANRMRCRPVLPEGDVQRIVHGVWLRHDPGRNPKKIDVMNDLYDLGVIQALNSPTAGHVMQYIWQQAERNHDRAARLTYEDLKRCGIKSRASISSAIKQLKDIGWLEIQHGYNSIAGWRTASTYRPTPTSRKFLQFVADCKK